MSPHLGQYPVQWVEPDRGGIMHDEVVRDRRNSEIRLWIKHPIDLPTLDWVDHDNLSVTDIASIALFGTVLSVPLGLSSAPALRPALAPFKAQGQPHAERMLPHARGGA